MNQNYFGAETAKAIENFPFSYRLVPKQFLLALVEIKQAAATAHFKNGELERAKKDAIVQACREILAYFNKPSASVEGKYSRLSAEALAKADGKEKFDDQFPLPVFQGGAGTSIHMNINEVIAGRATEILQNSPRPSLNKREGGVQVIHPNDDVNQSHSTNDVIPSALKITSIRLTQHVLVSATRLRKALLLKSKEFKDVIKLGRTHLQDAVPTTLGAEFGSYAEVIKRDLSRLELAMPYLLTLHLGGNAIGNSVNASKNYIESLYAELNKITKLKLAPAENFMALTASLTDFVMLSQALTAMTLDVSKIANDLRLLGSGPKGGFGEITLQELQKGSSMMPGKVNPILPEAVNQLYYLVSGNNLTIEHAAHGGQLELNVMYPVVINRMTEGLQLTAELFDQFAEKCILTIQANRKRCKELLEQSTAYATLLSPKLGYDAVATLVKESVRSGKTLREIVVGKKLLTNKEFDQIVNSFRP